MLSLNSHCEFIQYARALDLSLLQAQQGLCNLIKTNLTVISSCALNQSYLETNAIAQLGQLVFNTKTLLLSLKPSSSFFLAWIPTHTLLGYQELISRPKNLEEMLIIIAEKLKRLARLKFSGVEDDTFVKCLLTSHRGVHMGIIDLKEYYQKFVIPPSLDNERIF